MQAEPLRYCALPNQTAQVDTIEYRRVSSSAQAADDKSSLSDQGAANAAEAARRGRHIGLTFIEPGVSGATADRPEFQRMIAFCEDHPRPKKSSGYVFALNDSRFGRFDDVDEAAYWRHRLNVAGWIVQFAESDDIQHPTARAVVRTINSAQSADYRRNLSANSRRGKRGTATQGYWVTKAPFGYRRMVVVPVERSGHVLENGVPKAKDERIKLAFGPDREVRIVRWMFAAYNSGRHSITSITRRLQKLDTRLAWSRSFVHRVLSNPAYAGDVVGGRIRHDYHADDFVPKRDKSEWYFKLNAHPPLVSRELFDCIQRRLAAQSKHTAAPEKAYALSGIVKCAHCGEPYVGGGGGRDPRNPKTVRRFYKDRGGNEPSKCTTPLGTISRHILEHAVVSAIGEEVARPQTQAIIAEELDRLIGESEANLRTGAKETEAERRRLEKKRATLVEALGDGTLTKDEAAPALSQIRDALALLNQQVERSRHIGFARSRLGTERDRILTHARDFTATVQNLSGGALREFLAPWILAATFDKTARSLSLTMRLVPVTAPLLLSTSRETDSPSPAARAARTPSS